MMNEEIKLDNNTDYEKLFEQYYGPFCLYAHRFISDEEVCKDLVSDVFAMLWDKKDDFILHSDTVLAYIKMCVHNNCLNYLKHIDYERDYEDAFLKSTPIYNERPDSVYSLDEMYKMLYETLDKLPTPYREVFMKSFFEGKSRTEISEELDISIKTVNRYKRQAIELLKKELNDNAMLLSFLSILYIS
jgi:RNA polymerase sigma-70 factor (family 1)